MSLSDDFKSSDKAVEKAFDHFLVCCYSNIYKKSERILSGFLCWSYHPFTLSNAFRTISKSLVPRNPLNPTASLAPSCKVMGCPPS